MASSARPSALPERPYEAPPTRTSMRREPIDDFEATVPRAPRQRSSRNPSARVPPPRYEPRDARDSPRGTMLVVEQTGGSSGRPRRRSDDPPSPRSPGRSADYIDFAASQSARRERSTPSSIRSSGSHPRRRSSDASNTIRSRSGSHESGLSTVAGVSSPGRRSSRTLEANGGATDSPAPASSPVLSTGSSGSGRKGRRMTGSEGQLFGPSVLESSRSSRHVRKRASMVPEGDEVAERVESPVVPSGLQLDIPADPVGAAEPEHSPTSTVRAPPLARRSPSPPPVARSPRAGAAAVRTSPKVPLKSAMRAGTSRYHSDETSSSSSAAEGPQLVPVPSSPTALAEKRSSRLAMPGAMSDSLESSEDGHTPITPPATVALGPTLGKGKERAPIPAQLVAVPTADDDDEPTVVQGRRSLAKPAAAESGPASAEAKARPQRTDPKAAERRPIDEASSTVIPSLPVASPASPTEPVLKPAAASDTAVAAPWKHPLSASARPSAKPVSSDKGKFRLFGRKASPKPSPVREDPSPLTVAASSTRIPTMPAPVAANATRVKSVPAPAAAVVAAPSNTAADAPRTVLAPPLQMPSPVLAPVTSKADKRKSGFRMSLLGKRRAPSDDAASAPVPPIAAASAAPNVIEAAAKPAVADLATVDVPPASPPSQSLIAARHVSTASTVTSDGEDHFTDVESEREPPSSAAPDVDTVTISTAPATDTEDDDEAADQTLTGRAASLATAASAGLFGLLGLGHASVPTAADETGRPVAVPQLRVSEADGNSSIGQTDGASTIETTSASGHGHETEDGANEEPTPAPAAEPLARSGSQMSSNQSDSAVAQRFLSAGASRRSSGRPPSYRTWATGKTRDGKRSTSDSSHGDAAEPAVVATAAADSPSTASRLANAFSFSRPALDGGGSRRNSAISVATSANGLSERPKAQRTPSRLSLVINDFVASSMTSAMTLTDKLSGVDSAALPGNEALTRPKRRVTFREGEPEVADEGPTKKRLAPLFAGRVTISNSDVLRMREGSSQAIYEHRAPASPTGVMPSPYRSAIKRSSVSSGSGPASSAPASQPAATASRPDVPSLTRSEIDPPVARADTDPSRSTPAESSTTPVSRNGSSINLLAFARFGGGKGKETAKPAVAV